MISRSGTLVVALLLAGPCGNAPAEGLDRFITRRGDQLMDGDKPFRFISFNIPNLLVVEDAFEFGGASLWRWPNEYEIEDALESVRQMGGQVVRTYTISVHREGSDAGNVVHVLRPGEFNEEGFRTLDKVLEVANRKGIRVLIPLVDNWKWMGGVPQYAAFRGKPAEAFWTDRQIIDDFKATIRHVLDRRNTYTGKRYRDDPAILGWETGNEIDATPEWTRHIAAYLKQLDPNHLVFDGRSLHGVSAWQLEEPNTDVITTHHYPHASPDFAPAIREARAQTKGNKPYIVGEFGFVETPHIRDVLETIVQDDIVGALLWSLRFHRREGGFYWHMEVNTGRNFYKAYHWPGFDSGAPYDERAVLQLTRDKAFEIRGLDPPALQAPAQPTLLPIEDVAKISWQGSAGASSYDVLRSESLDGPWTVVGKDVSDAAVQYRPLFHDDQAKLGRTYCYSIVARNAAGDSEPSNVVGPVNVDRRFLVDELADLSLVYETEGNVVCASENARQFQEDCHRLALKPGSSVTYRLDGPVRAWRVFVFASDEHVPLDVTASPDGADYEPLAVTREVVASGQGEYGYATPILFHGDASRCEDRYLRISLAATAEPERLELSRVEIEFGDECRD